MELCHKVSKDLNITEISFDTGYNDITSFERTFKKFTGISPTKYRKLYKATTSDFMATIA